MKKIALLLPFILLSGTCFTSQAQVQVKLPKDFTVLVVSDVDSAVMMLDVLIKKQPLKKGTSLYLEANRDCLVRGRGKHYYYEDITSVSVTDYFIYEIIFKSKAAGSGHFRFNDRRLAEEACAALICLIKSKQGDNIKHKTVPSW
jgi:hypothetical protein